MVLIHLLGRDLIGMTKKTPRGRGSLQNTLINFGRHLIYSEGTKTEPYYIDNIKKRIAKKYNCETNSVQIVPVCKDKKQSFNTIGLVEYAQNDVSKRLSANEIINHVWILFDKDSFPKDDFNEAVNKINSKNDSDEKSDFGFTFEKRTNITWHSCSSNESFELWYLLYYDYIDSKLQRNQYIEKLREKDGLKHLSAKEIKSFENIHDVITLHGGSIKNAIRNAIKLNKQNGLENPSTYVVELAEFFMPYFDS